MNATAGVLSPTGVVVVALVAIAGRGVRDPGRNEPNMNLKLAVGGLATSVAILIPKDSHAGDLRSTSMIMEIRLSGTYFDGDGDDLDAYEDPYVGWSAEWGWQGDVVGVEEHGDDLAELVEVALQDVKRLADGRRIRLVWELADIDGLDAGAIEKELAVAAVHLPDRL